MPSYEEIKYKLEREWELVPPNFNNVSPANKIRNATALGIWLFAYNYQFNMHHPCSKEVIRQHFNIGVKKLDKCLKELKDAGCFVHTQVRGVGGRYLRSSYEFI